MQKRVKLMNVKVQSVGGRWCIVHIHTPLANNRYGFSRVEWPVITGAFAPACVEERGADEEQKAKAIVDATERATLRVRANTKLRERSAQKLVYLLPLSAVFPLAILYILSTCVTLLLAYPILFHLEKK